MMEASTKPVDGSLRAAVASNEARPATEDGAVGAIFRQWLNEAAETRPVAPALQWDEEDFAPAAEVEEPRVPASWLDALGSDYAEPREDRSDAISAVNSDDNGLYRMFRNVSP